MPVLGTIDWGTVGQLLWAAPVAGLAVSISFSLLILGAARANDARRSRSGAAAAAYSALAIVAGIAFAAVVIYGIQVITTKS